MSDRIIRALRDEIDALREQVASLRAALSECEPPPAAWGLTPHEARAFGALVRCPCASSRALLAALSAGRPGADAEAGPNMVYVVIHHVRRKLRPFGVEITTRPGYGYALDARTRAAFAQQIAGTA